MQSKHTQTATTREPDDPLPWVTEKVCSRAKNKTKSGTWGATCGPRMRIFPRRKMSTQGALAVQTYMAQEAELVVFPPEAAVVSAGRAALP